MNEIARKILEDEFTRTLMDSMPCGVIVVNSDGHVQAVNNIVENVLGVTEQNIIGKGSGEALGCIKALENPNGCGSGISCAKCELRKLAIRSITKNKKQKSRIYLQVIINGQIREITLMISVVPANFMNEQFAIIILVDITSLEAFSSKATETGFRGIVGRDPKMLEVFNTIRQVAQTDAAVLIQGESGTGKELVAFALHKESLRANKHFAPFNCGALPEGLVESELFGHVRGAFTGATRDKKGRFELAHGGTIFLDEVGELRPEVQVKLLRVLQGGNFERVGSEQTVSTNVRVISATNKNLKIELAEGRFRRDLYYRLCVMPITLPPLRERREDIPLLTEHFLSHFSRRPEHQDSTLTPDTLSLLMGYPWPGNVRELENVLQFALVKSGGHLIEPEHLHPALQRGISTMKVSYRKPKLNIDNVTEALQKTNGNRKRAAEILNVSRSTLYRFLERQNN